MSEAEHQELVQATDRVSTSSDQTNNLLRQLRWVLAVLFVLVVGLATATVRYNHAAEKRADHYQQLLADTQDQVHAVKAYVDQLTTTTPDEAARNAAIAKAISQVPQIKSILCDPNAFPDAVACRIP